MKHENENVNSRGSERAVSTKQPKTLRGPAIILHRRFVAPCFPIAEAGPSAVIVEGSDDWHEQDRRAAALQSGDFGGDYGRGIYSAWLGVRPGERQTVAIVAPWSPPAAAVASRRATYQKPVAWQEWHGGPLPRTRADAVIVWLPEKCFARASLAQIAERLVAEAFGVGAIYDTAEFASSKPA